MLRFSSTLTPLIFIAIVSCQRQQTTEPINNLPPSTPINLTVYAAYDGQIGLSWQHNTEPDLDGYKIYRSVNDTIHFIFIKSTNDRIYIDEYLEYDSLYYYKISAINKSGKESNPTSAVSAKPINMFNPLRPQYININAKNLAGNIYILLNWSPSIDKDIKHYEIYRDTTSFELDPTKYLDSTPNTFYSDTKNLKLLQKYYYRIVAVDKGGLKSSGTIPVSDLILNTPTLIYPPNNTSLTSLTEFRFRAISKPVRYKLIIQPSEFYGLTKEVEFYSDKVNEVISVDVKGIRLEPFKMYYWRIITFSDSSSKPNSYSELFSFSYSPYLYKEGL